MTDLISKTSLIQWVKDILLGVEKMCEEHVKTARLSMSKDEIFEGMELTLEFERKMQILKEAIELIEGYTPTASPAPESQNTEFKQFERVFEEWVEATNRVNLAQKSLDEFIAKILPDTPPDGSPAEVEDAYLAEIAKVKAIHDEQQETIQRLKNIACFLAYRLSVCFPSAFPNRESYFSNTMRHIGKYGVVIRRAYTHEPKIFSLHWMPWEEAIGMPVSVFMATAESATIE